MKINTRIKCDNTERLNKITSESRLKYFNFKLGMVIAEFLKISGLIPRPGGREGKKGEFPDLVS